MYLEGQILADLENHQLVMYLGGYLVKGDDGEMHLAVAYMNEERFKNTPKKVSLQDCMLNLKTSILEGIEPPFDSFDKAKKAIKKAGKVYAQDSRWGEDHQERVYDDKYEITIVDDNVVFTNLGGGGKSF